MTKIDITKRVVRYAVHYGTGIIVNQIVANNVRTQRIDQQVGVAVASFAIGGAVGEAAGTHTDQFIDEIAEAVTSFKKN